MVATKYTTETAHCHVAQNDNRSHSSINHKCFESARPQCSCNKRFECEICRNKWVTRRTKDRKKTLLAGLPRNHQAYFTTLSIRTGDDWVSDAHQLLDYWREVGRERYAVLMTTPAFSPQALYGFWAQLTGGCYAEVQPARSFGASVRYSIQGDLPPTAEDKARLQDIFRGKQLVRSIGK